MNCQQAEPLLARAADGTLEAERGAALALHLDGCVGCQDALDAQRAVQTWLAARPQAPAPLGFATRVMANLPERETLPASGWLEALNWRAWTLRLAPVAGALFAGAALGLGQSTDVAEAATPDYSDVVTEWMAEETANGEVLETPAADAMARLWQAAEETTDDLLIDILMATDPDGALSGAGGAGR